MKGGLCFKQLSSDNTRKVYKGIKNEFLMGVGDPTGTIRREMDLQEWLSGESNRYAVYITHPAHELTTINRRSPTWSRPLASAIGEAVLLAKTDPNARGNLALLFGKLEAYFQRRDDNYPIFGLKNPVYLSTWSKERLRGGIHPGSILLPDSREQTDQVIVYDTDTVYVGDDAVLDALDHQKGPMMSGTKWYANIIRAAGGLQE